MSGLKGLLVLARPKGGDEEGEEEGSERDSAIDDLAESLGVRVKDRELFWSAFQSLAEECSGPPEDEESDAPSEGD